MSVLDERMGPKMARLTPMRRAFVLAIMTQGDRNAAAAAEKAGYKADNRDSLYVMAHRLWHDEDVQAAIHEEAHKRLKGMLPMAVNVIAEVMENKQETGATRVKAAMVTMDRAGLHSVTEKIVTDGGITSDPDRVKRIMAMAAALGLPLEKLLGDRAAAAAPQPVLIYEDAEYQELSSEGLEDLL